MADGAVSSDRQTARATSCVAVHPHVGGDDVVLLEDDADAVLVQVRQPAWRAARGDEGEGGGGRGAGAGWRGGAGGGWWGGGWWGGPGWRSETDDQSATRTAFPHERVIMKGNPIHHEIVLAPALWWCGVVWGGGGAAHP